MWVLLSLTRVTDVAGYFGCKVIVSWSGRYKFDHNGGRPLGAQTELLSNVGLIRAEKEGASVQGQNGADIDTIVHIVLDLNVHLENFSHSNNLRQRELNVERTEHGEVSGLRVAQTRACRTQHQRAQVVATATTWSGDFQLTRRHVFRVIEATPQPSGIHGNVRKHTVVMVTMFRVMGGH
uniref:Uncharacterized protein n=1 Tax=Cacopsylla melanoneura TaxID=428564 RepID=A0A8D8WNN0_9HEMI